MICVCEHTLDIHLRERQPETPEETERRTKDPKIKEKFTYEHTICQGMWCECKKFKEKL